MCNRNGISRLMSGEDKLTLVPLRHWDYTVCSFKYFVHCIQYTLTSRFLQKQNEMLVQVKTIILDSLALNINFTYNDNYR